MQNIRHRLFKGTLWLASARVATNLLSLVSTFFLARLLVPADFGLVALGTTILTIVNSVTNISLSQALVQHRAPTTDHFHTAWTLNFGRAAIIAALMAASAQPLSVFFEDTRLVSVILVLSLSMLCSGLENPRAIMLTRDLVFWQQFMLQVSQTLVSLVVSIVLAVLYQSYWALVIGTVAGQVAGVMLSYGIMPFRPRFKVVHTKELFSFSLWLTFCQIITTINWNFDQLLVGKFLGQTALGYYTVGNKIAIIPSREATAPLTVSLFPAFSRVADDRSRLAAAYQSATGLAAAIALPLGVGTALIADPLVRLTMGEKWLPTVLMIQVLACVFGFQSMFSLVQPLVMATGRTQLLFKRDLQAFAARIPLLVIGLYFGGLPGVVYARAVSGTATFFMQTSMVTQVTGLTFMEQARAHFRALAASVVMAAAVVPITMAMPDSFRPLDNALEIAALVLIGGAAYIAATLVLWMMMRRPEGPEAEILRIIDKVRNFLRRAPA
ncbi:lipopolysaccharide biosynthesis protein [Dongia sedimenti]|uniref:Lipopolysaccharide biosynthesis protein n=1 Tax=Dongia sedimenti TaxID=3064282 RepID=A0ABU0YR74_9PROT|nr:lipopolysaccharide biosynthesis protein [Rhodospirillaceae bacterium R-7]